MFTRTIKCKDFNGNEREQSFTFGFLKHELIDLEWRTPGGLEAMYKRIIETQDGEKLADEFRRLIVMSYGVKSPDGMRFIKTPEVVQAFTQTKFYDELYTELATNSDSAAKFVNGIFPKDEIEAIKKDHEKAVKAGIAPVITEAPALAPGPAPAQPELPFAAPQANPNVGVDPITGNPL